MNYYGINNRGIYMATVEIGESYSPYAILIYHFYHHEWLANLNEVENYQQSDSAKQLHVLWAEKWKQSTREDTETERTRNNTSIFMINWSKRW